MGQPLGCHVLPRSEIEVPEDDGQQIVEVVRDAAGDRSDGLQSLRPMEGLLDTLPLRYIHYNAGEPDRGAVLGMVDAAVDDDRTRGSVGTANTALEAQRAGVHCRIETARDCIPILGDDAGEQDLAVPFRGSAGITEDLIMAW